MVTPAILFAKVTKEDFIGHVTSDIYADLQYDADDYDEMAFVVHDVLIKSKRSRRHACVISTTIEDELP